MNDFVVFLLLSATVMMAFYAVAHAHKRRRERRWLRWANTEELRPDVVKAYERGRMTNEQMTALLRACGWNARQGKDGRIIVDDEAPHV